MYNIIYGIDPSEHPDLPVEARKDNGFHADLKTAMSSIEQIFKPYVEREKRRT
jgi:hypothetical protein